MLNILYMAIIFACATLLAKLGDRVYKYTKISSSILFLVIGLTLSIVVKGNIITGTEVVSSFGIAWSTYQKYGLYLLFYASGFQILYKEFVQTGKLTLKLSTLPVYSEALVMFIILSITNWIFFNQALSWYEVLFVTTLFAMSSPANVIPITSYHLSKQRTVEKEMAKSIITTSVLDNIMAFPVIIILLPIFQTKIFTLESLAINLGTFILLSLITIIVSVSIALVIKNGHLKITILEKKIHIVLLLLFYVFTMGLNSYDMSKIAMSNFSFIIAIIAGTVTANAFNSDISKRIASKLSKLFSNSVLPIIFISVGYSLNITNILDLSTILLCSIYLMIALLTKCLVTYCLLNKEVKRNPIKYVCSAFVPKGITLINFSVVLLAIIPSDSQVLRLMGTLGALSVIISLPIGLTLMTNKGSRWLG